MPPFTSSVFLLSFQPSHLTTLGLFFPRSNGFSSTSIPPFATLVAHPLHPHTMSLPHTSNNKALGRTPEQYSTNPSTIKARRRKMNLNGAKKVEDAARTADYKAMIYARKVVQAKSEFLTASAVDKPAMLEKAMRETMEKRSACSFVFVVPPPSAYPPT